MTIAAKNNGAYWDLGTPAGLLDLMHNIGLFNDAQYETITEYQKHEVELDKYKTALEDSNASLADARSAMQESQTQAQYFSEELDNLKKTVSDATGAASESFSETENTLKTKTEAMIKHFQDTGTGVVVDVQTPMEGLKQATKESI